MPLRLDQHLGLGWCAEAFPVEQLVSRHGWPLQLGSASHIDPVLGNHILGEIDTDAQNAHDVPFRMS
jgi:hypothetical protein